MGVNTDVVTGVVCVGVLLRIGVFLFVLLTDIGVFFLLPRLVCLVDGSSSFFQGVHALSDWHFPRPAGLLPLELSMALRSFLRSDFCRRLVLHPTTRR